MRNQWKRMVETMASNAFQDYSFTEEGENNKQITIWINWGQDQAAALNSLIQD